MLKFFRLPFATTGDKTAVPDAVDTNGNVSYSQGYGFDYQRQKTDPAAKNIERDKMNQIFFDVTTAVAELQANGIPDFITTALNGGTAYSYAQYAVVKYSGDLYISLVAANTALPSDATKWALLPTPARIQAAFNTAVVAAGTADALTGAFSPAIAALPAAPGTLSALVRAGSANATATPTFKADSALAKTIVKGNNLPLVAGDIAGAGHWLDLQYDATLDKWVLLNPATGVAAVKQIQNFTCTQSTNILTGAFPATSLDYRSATATTGTPVTQANGALSLAIPATSNLGMLLTAQVNRLVWAVAYNAGSPVLCVTNLAGGLPMDETGFISPTTIGASSNAANVWYSASAVAANSPYRIVGFSDAVFTTGTGWSNPTLVQPVGGQSMASMNSIGYGQTWQSVVGSRTPGTTYYNTTGKPIFVSATTRSTTAASTASATVNGVNFLGTSLTVAGIDSGIAFIVPPGGSYSVTANAGPSSFGSFCELR